MSAQSTGPGPAHPTTDPSAPRPPQRPSAPRPAAPAPAFDARSDGAAPGPLARPVHLARKLSGRTRIPWQLLALAVVIGLAGWLASLFFPPRSAGPLTASGTLEADEVLVGAEVGGRIVGLVREGQQVSAG